MYLQMSADTSQCFCSKKFDLKKLSTPIFRVRRHVIEEFLRFLALYNPLYKDVSINKEDLTLYPEDGFLPTLAESVIVNAPSARSAVLAEDIAPFEVHPVRIIADGTSVLSNTSNPIHVTPEDHPPPVLSECGL
jgi:hypothetical protein